MRVFAIHDTGGRISQVVTCPADAPPPVLTPPQGLFWTEIEPPKGSTDTDLQSDAHLVELMKSYRVEIVPRKAVLLPLDNKPTVHDR
jgi:hypothetical protein